jgi:exodeoxyribonuclease V alpha subunit
MQTANDYDKDAFNGDIGFVRTVDLDAQEIVIDFDGRPITYDFGELDEVSPARHDLSQSAGLEIPSGGNSPRNATLSDAAPQPGVYRYHTRRAAGRARRPAPGLGDRGEGFRRQARWSKLRQWLRH